jgi:hypothetical protein
MLLMLFFMREVVFDRLPVQSPLLELALGAAAGGLAYATAFFLLPIKSLTGERERWLRALRVRRA